LFLWHGTLCLCLMDSRVRRALPGLLWLVSSEGVTSPEEWQIQDAQLGGCPLHPVT
jgi:hypothetical protein